MWRCTVGRSLEARDIREGGVRKGAGGRPGAGAAPGAADDARASTGDSRAAGLSAAGLRAAGLRAADEGEDMYAPRAEKDAP